VGRVFLKNVHYTCGKVVCTNPLDNVRNNSLKKINAAADEAKRWNNLSSCSSYNDKGIQAALKRWCQCLFEQRNIESRKRPQMMAEKGAFLSTQTGNLLGGCTRRLECRFRRQ